MATSNSDQMLITFLNISSLNIFEKEAYIRNILRVSTKDFSGKGKFVIINKSSPTWNQTEYVDLRAVYLPSLWR